MVLNVLLERLRESLILMIYLLSRELGSSKESEWFAEYEIVTHTSANS